MMNETDDGGRIHWWADATPRDWRNLRRFLAALAAWAVTFLGGAHLVREGLVSPGPVGWLVAVLPGIFAVLAVVGYGRYLRDADEFQRMIHLQALGFGFAGGWLIGASYRLFELLGAPRADRGDVAIMMAGFYTVGLLLGHRRYR